MGELSLLDRAAEVRAKAQEVRQLADQVKAAGGEWVGYSIAAEESVEIGHSGLRHAWTMLDRFGQQLRAELDRAKKEPRHD
jgi:hypothetical protein